MKWATINPGNAVCTIPPEYVYDATNDRLDCGTNYWSSDAANVACTLCDTNAHRIKDGTWPTYTCECNQADGYYDVSGTCVMKACQTDGQQSGE